MNELQYTRDAELIGMVIAAVPETGDYADAGTFIAQDPNNPDRAFIVEAVGDYDGGAELRLAAVV